MYAITIARQKVVVKRDRAVNKKEERVVRYAIEIN